MASLQQNTKVIRSFKIIAQFMIKPLSLIPNGIKVEPLGNSYLFRFNEPLQNRLEDLLEKSKLDRLTPEETNEWAGIKELSQIFTLINAELAAKAQWCPTQPDSLSDHAANSVANTATPPNT